MSFTDHAIDCLSEAADRQTFIRMQLSALSYLVSWKNISDPLSLSFEVKRLGSAGLRLKFRDPLRLSVKLHVSVGLRVKLHVSVGLRLEFHVSVCLTVKLHVFVGLRVKLHVSVWSQSAISCTLWP
jgi:hypothetical protein